MTREDTARGEPLGVDRGGLTVVLIVTMIVGAVVLALWLPYLDAGPWPLFIGLSIVTLAILVSSGSILTMSHSITMSARCWFLTGFLGLLALVIFEYGSISSDGAAGGMLVIVSLLIYGLIASLLGAIFGVVAHLGFLVVRRIAA